MFLAALRLGVYDGDVGEAELPAVVPGVPVPAGVGAGGAPPAHADLRVPGARVDLVASE